jgi:uncharacterized membrane protein YfcA
VEWVALFMVAVIVGVLVAGIVGLVSGREDWKGAVRFTAIIGAVFVGAAVLVFIFDAVWAEAGFLGAAVLVAVALFVLKKWDDRQAARDRERFARS